MTLLLAADTSTSINTVAITRDTTLLAEASVHNQRMHAERLIATVDWLLQESGHTLQNIDVFAVARGPGSFTGLRIGIATWKGFAFGLKKPLIGVSTLDAFARQVPLQTGVVAILLDARMQEVYGALYRADQGKWLRVGEEAVAPVEHFTRLAAELDNQAVFAGDGADQYRDRLLKAMPRAHILDSRAVHPRASMVAAEALHLIAQGAPADGASLSPVYLRQSQAEQHRASKNAGAA